MSRLSIRARLTAAFAAAMVLLLVLAGLFVYARVSSELSGALDDRLEARANDLAALVATGGAGARQLTDNQLIDEEEDFYAVIDPSGRVLASTLPAGSPPVLSAEQLASAGAESVLSDGHDVPGVEGEARVLAEPASTPEGEVIVVAGASTDDRYEALAGLRRAFLVGGPLALVLASGLGYLLAGRALGPVNAMRSRAERITLEQSGERLPLPRAEDEIHELGETLNAMLDRIETSLERERVFVADASHELRTPLAILRTELELADRERRTPEELRESLRSAQEEVHRLSQLAEDLLVIARSDGGGLALNRERVELGALLERVGERFARRAEQQGREIALDTAAPIEVEIDRMRVEQAIANLVENALRHGGGEIRLGAARNGADAAIDVSDAGPGFAPGFAAEAFERFTRAAGGRTGGGSGLGLAIVRAIARAHGGEATLIDAGAGATVRITLPL